MPNWNDGRRSKRLDILQQIDPHHLLEMIAVVLLAPEPLEAFAEFRLVGGEEVCARGVHRG